MSTIERSVQSLSDDELLRVLSELLRSSRRTEASLVAHLAEVDARRLYARAACPSMYAYCTQVLGLSEPEAYLRIAAARASREHPQLLAMLADGRMHLSGIVLLAPHLTAASRDSLLERAAHRSKRQIEELVAEVAPRPDARSGIRRLPVRLEAPRPGDAPGGPAAVRSRSASATAAVTIGPADRDGSGGGRAGVRPDGSAVAGVQLRPDGVALAEARPRLPLVGGVDARGGTAAETGKVRPVDGGVSKRLATVEPLAPGRYKVQFTASAALREKLERLQALMRPAVPDGDLAAIIEAAVTEKLERLEARRFGATTRPRTKVPASAPRTTSRHIPAAVRRAVRARDGDRCCYADSEGRRCTARRYLEFHHRHPYRHGGGHAVENVSLMCRGHNRLLAEIDYGPNRLAAGVRSGRVLSGARVARGEEPQTAQTALRL